MTSIAKRKIGDTDLAITELGMGCAPIGGWPVAVSDEIAFDTLKKAWEEGIRYFDTAPLYGSGMSEIRVGEFLSKQNRDEFVISTKVGRLIIETENSKAAEKFKGQPLNKDSKFDFSYDATMRSFEDSLKRLKLDRVDILHLHDPDNSPDALYHAKRGAIKAMIKLREEKVIKAIGCGLNQNEMLIELAQLDCFDCFLLAGRYTLIDQTSIERLIPICEEKNITLILGGIFNSGILNEPSPNSYFDYSKLDQNWAENLATSLVRIPKDFETADYWLDKAYALQDACKKFNISLRHAAIQFPYANKIVSTCILGMTNTDQVEENVNLYKDPISSDFWEYLTSKKLLDNRCPLPT